MATKLLVCPACDSPLVRGRYSCTSCGAVVAAVASDARSFTAAEPVVPPILEPGPAARTSDEPVPGRFDADEQVSDGSAEDEVSWPVPDPVVAAVPVPATGYPTTPGQPVAPAPGATSWPPQPAWPPPLDAQIAPTAPTALQADQRTPAGAYLPPSAVLPSGEALPVNGKGGAKPAGADATAPRPSLAERLALGEADGPLGLPPEMPGRTITLGVALAGLGFLLPWAEYVFGTSSMGGFLDQWGLAGPGHPLMLLLLLGVGALAVASERLTTRVSAGTAAIVLGAVLLGLVFPYLMGPYQEAVGVYVVFAGALVMIAGGLLARAPRRHEPEDVSV